MAQTCTFSATPNNFQEVLDQAWVIIGDNGNTSKHTGSHVAVTKPSYWYCPEPLKAHSWGYFGWRAKLDCPIMHTMSSSTAKFWETFFLLNEILIAHHGGSRPDVSTAQKRGYYICS